MRQPTDFDRQHNDIHSRQQQQQQQIRKQPHVSNYRRDRNWTEQEERDRSRPDYSLPPSRGSPKVFDRNELQPYREDPESSMIYERTDYEEHSIGYGPLLARNGRKPESRHLRVLPYIDEDGANGGGGGGGGDISLSRNAAYQAPSGVQMARSPQYIAYPSQRPRERYPPGQGQVMEQSQDRTSYGHRSQSSPIHKKFGTGGNYPLYGGNVPNPTRVAGGGGGPTYMTSAASEAYANPASAAAASSFEPNDIYWLKREPIEPVDLANRGYFSLRDDPSGMNKRGRGDVRALLNEESFVRPAYGTVVRQLEPQNYDAMPHQPPADAVKTKKRAGLCKSSAARAESKSKQLDQQQREGVTIVPAPMYAPQPQPILVPPSQYIEPRNVNLTPPSNPSPPLKSDQSQTVSFNAPPSAVAPTKTVSGTPTKIRKIPSPQRTFYAFQKMKEATSQYISYLKVRINEMISQYEKTPLSPMQFGPDRSVLMGPKDGHKDFSTTKKKGTTKGKIKSGSSTVGHNMASPGYFSPDEPEYHEGYSDNPLILEKKIKNAQRLLKHLEYHVTKIDRLYDDYLQAFKLRDGTRTMSFDYADPKKKKSSKMIKETLHQLEIERKECDKTMCYIENRLQTLMGTFHFVIKEISGYARIGAGDQFQMSMKYAFPKFKKFVARCRVDRKLFQHWDKRGRAYPLLLHENMSMKAREMKTLGSNLLVKTTLDPLDLISIIPVLKYIRLTPNGSLKLNVLFFWNPLGNEQAEELDFLYENSAFYDRFINSKTPSEFVVSHLPPLALGQSSASSSSPHETSTGFDSGYDGGRTTPPHVQESPNASYYAYGMLPSSFLPDKGGPIYGGSYRNPDMQFLPRDDTTMSSYDTRRGNPNGYRNVNRPPGTRDSSYSSSLERDNDVRDEVNPREQYPPASAEGYDKSDRRREHPDTGARNPADLYTNERGTYWNTYNDFPRGRVRSRPPTYFGDDNFNAYGGPACSRNNGCYGGKYQWDDSTFNKRERPPVLRAGHQAEHMVDDGTTYENNATRGDKWNTPSRIVPIVVNEASYGNREPAVNSPGQNGIGANFGYQDTAYPSNYHSSPANHRADVDVTLDLNKDFTDVIHELRQCFTEAGNNDEGNNYSELQDLREIVEQFYEYLSYISSPNINNRKQEDEDRLISDKTKSGDTYLSRHKDFNTTSAYGTTNTTNLSSIPENNPRDVNSTQINDSKPGGKKRNENIISTALRSFDFLSRDDKKRNSSRGYKTPSRIGSSIYDKSLYQQTPGDDRKYPMNDSGFEASQNGTLNRTPKITESGPYETNKPISTGNIALDKCLRIHLAQTGHALKSLRSILQEQNRTPNVSGANREMRLNTVKWLKTIKAQSLCLEVYFEIATHAAARDINVILAILNKYTNLNGWGNVNKIMSFWSKALPSGTGGGGVGGGHLGDANTQILLVNARNFENQLEREYLPFLLQTHTQQIISLVFPKAINEIQKIIINPHIPHSSDFSISERSDMDVLGVGYHVTLLQLILYIKMNGIRDYKATLNDLAKELEFRDLFNAGNQNGLIRYILSLNKSLPPANSFDMICRLLCNNDEINRFTVAYLQGLTNNPETRKRAIYQALACLESNDIVIRCGACRALQNLKATEATNQLLDTFTSDPNIKVNESARIALLNLGPTGIQAYEQLIGHGPNRDDHASQRSHYEANAKASSTFTQSNGNDRFSSNGHRVQGFNKTSNEPGPSPNYYSYNPDSQL